MKRFKKPLVVGVIAILMPFVAAFAYRFARAERYWLLDRACAAGDTSRVALLLRLGADPNGRWDTRYYMDYGWTVNEPTPPLWIAASCGHTEIVWLLLSSGANPNIRAIDRMTPREIAEREGHIAVVQAIDDAQHK